MLSWPDVTEQQWHLLDLCKGVCTLSVWFCTYSPYASVYMVQRLCLLLAKSNEDIIVFIYLASLQAIMKHACACRWCKYVNVCTCFCMLNLHADFCVSSSCFSESKISLMSPNLFFLCASVVFLFYTFKHSITICLLRNYYNQLWMKHK